MRKTDVYKIRALFEKIEIDYSNDRSSERADKIYKTIKNGVNLCNQYINKMKPLNPNQ